MLRIRASLGQVVLLWVLAVSVAGCFRSNRAADDEPVTCECCGVEVEVESRRECMFGACDFYCIHGPDAGVDAALADAGTDAGAECDCCGTPVPAGPGGCTAELCAPHCGRCELQRTELTEVDFVRAGSPTSLPTHIRGCFCGESLTCEVSVDEGSRTIDMRTTLCRPDLLCDACHDLETGCEVPALAEGRWSVRVNGDWAYDLDAIPPDIHPERLDAVLVTHAPVDEACGIVWPPERYEPYFACITPEVETMREFAIQVWDECAPLECGHRGGHCKVTVLDGVITVTPHRTFTECDIAACPPVCMPREDVCWVPPLPAGDYEVRIPGETRGRVRVTDMPSPSEACAP